MVMYVFGVFRLCGYVRLAILEDAEAQAPAAVAVQSPCTRCFFLFRRSPCAPVPVTSANEISRRPL